MRQSTLFGRTLREVPSEAQTPGHQLMLRAAIARQTAAGLYTLLPLGFRVAQKIERIVREEMDRIGCQELEMPVLSPAELWQETGRWDLMDPILFKMKDHNKREFLVSYTHEEVVTHHARNEILSYRQLPVMVYHFQSKGRDEARPRAGLLRAREFVMKDAYSIDADAAGLDRSYELQYQAYARSFERMGLSAISVESDTGAMGGDVAHEFQVLTDVGEDRILICSSCDYRANNEKASRKHPPDAQVGDNPTSSAISTPGVSSVAALVASLGVQASDLLKTVLVKGKAGQVVAVVLPGDREANEAKLRKLLDVGEIQLADDADFKKVGGVAGFVGPVGLRARIVIDSSVGGRPYISGSNRKDEHLRDVVAERDFQGERADVHDVLEGDLCANCGGSLQLKRGVEVGNIFKLGTYYSEKMGATYLAADGTRKPFVMGSYGIGMGRALQTIIETNRDEQGIVWPISVAPYEAHVIALPMKDDEVRTTAERMVTDLESKGVEVLYDDRDDSAGVKFADSDLIGIPFRVTVSRRGLKDGKIELKARSATEVELLDLATAADRVAGDIRRARDARI